MAKDSEGRGPHYTAQACEIIAAYVSNNHVAPQDLPALIAQVHAAVRGLDAGGATAAAAPEPVEQPGAAQIRNSVQPDGIVSFIDGRSYKTLKRHLTGHGLTPDTYRARYGLPADYPMVAPSYSEQRSSLARAIGLGVPGSRAKNALLDEVKGETEVEQPAPKGSSKKAA